MVETSLRAKRGVRGTGGAINAATSVSLESDERTNHFVTNLGSKFSDGRDDNEPEIELNGKQQVYDKSIQKGARRTKHSKHPSHDERLRLQTTHQQIRSCHGQGFLNGLIS